MLSAFEVVQHVETYTQTWHHRAFLVLFLSLLQWFLVVLWTILLPVGLLMSLIFIVCHPSNPPFLFFSGKVDFFFTSLCLIFIFPVFQHLFKQKLKCRIDCAWDKPRARTLACWTTSTSPSGLVTAQICVTSHSAEDKAHWFLTDREVEGGCQSNARTS